MPSLSLGPNDEEMSKEIEQSVRQYAQTVYRLALSRTRDTHSAEDVFQEVFLRLLKWNKPFESEEHRRAWLIRVTINCSKKWLCSAWIRRTAPLNESLSIFRCWSCPLNIGLSSICIITND